MANESAYQEFTGKSVEEALKGACEAFKVGIGDLDFEIIAPGSRGVLGMGAERLQVLHHQLRLGKHQGIEPLQHVAACCCPPRVHLQQISVVDVAVTKGRNRCDRSGEGEGLGDRHQLRCRSGHQAATSPEWRISASLLG